MRISRTCLINSQITHVIPVLLLIRQQNYSIDLAFSTTQILIFYR